MELLAGATAGCDSTYRLREALWARRKERARDKKAWPTSNALVDRYSIMIANLQRAGPVSVLIAILVHVSSVEVSRGRG